MEAPNSNSKQPDDNKSKPLRNAGNTLKDIYNTYLKREPELHDITKEHLEEIQQNAHPRVESIRKAESSSQSAVGTERDIEETRETRMDREIPITEDSTVESGSSQREESITEVHDRTELEIALDRISELEEEKRKEHDKAIRAIAELENMRRRTQSEMQNLREYAAEHILTKMLPIVDDLHAAVDSARANPSTDAQAMMTGIELIYAKAVKIFESAGVKTIEISAGQPFNVDFHEALMHMPHEDHPEGHVVQEIQRGFLLNDKVIRHSKVVTSAGKPE